MRPLQNEYSGTADHWQLKTQKLSFGRIPVLMGIVNVTPDSFSDGGSYLEKNAAVDQALQLVDAGAGIIDVGGESTRPYSRPVSEAEELCRVVETVERIASQTRVPVSIDTSKSKVAAECLAAGAEIINDVTGFSNPGMRLVAAGSNCGMVLMHMLGTPRNMQTNPQYENVTNTVISYWKKQLDLCMKDGISSQRVVLDPGIGFGKSIGHNLELLKAVPEMCNAGRPLLMGISRKSFIAALVGKEGIDEREWPTVALSAYLRQQGAAILRVHDPKPNLYAMRMSEAILQG